MADFATAVLGASATVAGVFLAQFVGESYKRFRDGSAIAAGILGELRSYEENKPNFDEAIGEWIRAIDHGLRDQLIFRFGKAPPHVYFDVVTDKIGLLGSELVGDVVFVYAKVTAFEGSIEIICEQHKEMSDTELRLRAVALQGLVKEAWDRGQALLPRLEARANASFWPFRL